MGWALSLQALSFSSFPRPGIPRGIEKRGSLLLIPCRRGRVSAASEKKESSKITSGSGEEEGGEKSSFNPFGFVTDNPSSRSAIQLPESPAEDGNVGQMLYVCKKNCRFSVFVFVFFFLSISHVGRRREDLFI